MTAKPSTLKIQDAVGYVVEQGVGVRVDPSLELRTWGRVHGHTAQARGVLRNTVENELLP